MLLGLCHVRKESLLKIPKLESGEIKKEKEWKIGHARYSSILTRFQGLRYKLLNLVLFSTYPGLFWELWDKGNLEVCDFDPNSLGSMFDYWHIERGLLSPYRHRC